MRTYNFIVALAAVLRGAIAIPSRAAEKQRPAQGDQNRPKKLWTNDDLGQSHARGLISIVGPELSGVPAQPTTAPPEPTLPV
jgi:hypothetical protein